MKLPALLVAAAVLAAPAALAGQGTALDEAAAAARDAWLRHDVTALVASAPNLVVQLPGTAPAPAVGRAQAEVLLRAYLVPADEVAVRIASVRELQPGRGSVELWRRYRVTGTAEEREQTVLLGYRLDAGRWRLTELRADGP